MKQNYFSWKNIIVFLGLAGAALGGYLLASASYYRIGFPLDDAWIHQTYARNLASSGQWVFTQGFPSSGSTSPLWTAILSLGYFISSNPYWWAFLLGGLCLAGIGWITNTWMRTPSVNGIVAFLIGVWFVFEWHLVWAAGAGMETILYSLVILSFFLSLRSQRLLWCSGLLAGLSIWLRPDGITLLGPLLFVFVFDGNKGGKKLKAGLVAAILFMSIIVGYLGFNFQLSHSFWPNTFYAKQAEYAELLQLPFFQRYASLMVLPFIGGGLLLFPGVVHTAIRSVRNRDWVMIAVLLWWLGYIGLYALRLPVTYQHGRYLIPAMPVVWLLGWKGTLSLIKKMGTSDRLGRLLKTAAWAFIILLQLGFYTLGMTAYRLDSAIIETEMVNTALWINKNTPTHALIAVHDIGAIGYFGERNILDMAGLVSPEVIPFIRNEEKLGKFILAQGATYLVTFPGWYPDLVKGKQVLYVSPWRFSPNAGGENMHVYLIGQ